jgi:DNA-binding response OmpR family regulator
MTPSATLHGLRVLVVEDDFYLATDEQAALEAAGATVLGPTARAEEALRLADSARVDCAVVDINLGTGPGFSVAAALRERSIPFVFTTGYDAAAIPEEFRDVERLEKPVEDADLVAAVRRVRRA